MPNSTRRISGTFGCWSRHECVVTFSLRIADLVKEQGEKDAQLRTARRFHSKYVRAMINVVVFSMAPLSGISRYKLNWKIASFEVVRQEYVARPSS